MSETDDVRLTVRRQVVQIAVEATALSQTKVFALCNDGTLWYLKDPSICDTPRDWVPLPKVPA